MRFRTLDWDAANVDHIAHHGLEPSEVETACRGSALILRGRGGRYLAYGQTSAGRYLLVILRSVGGGRARVITARDMTEREKRFYRERS